MCQSTFHWACPHKSEQVKLTEDHANDQVEECNITLYTKESPTAAEIFVTRQRQKLCECFGLAIIDTACTWTVCGQQWLHSYITGLSERELNEVKKTETYSHRPFRFGDGEVIHSTKKFKIPAKNGETECHLETDVVPADIPLLLSKASMKQGQY